MTTIVALHLGSHVLLAADKRVVYLNGGTAICLNDDADKLIEWHSGVITGCGNAEMLESLKNKVANTKITNTSQVVDMVKETTDEFCNLHGYWLDTTHWFYTYLAEEGGNVVARLNMISANTGDNMQAQPGEVTIMSKVPNLDAIITSSKSQIKTNDVLNEEYFQKGDFAHNCEIIRQIFQICSDQTDDTSSSYDLYLTSAIGSKFIR